MSRKVREGRSLPWWSLGVSLGLGCLGLPAQAQEPPGLIFREGFEDARLTDRGWYDGSRFSLAEDAAAGSHSLRYTFKAGDLTPSDSSGVRRLFEPTEVVYLRFSLKLAPGWSWTGRPYGPHLLHFLTTANGKFHGPAQSHLRRRLEPRLGARGLRLSPPMRRALTLEVGMQNAGLGTWACSPTGPPWRSPAPSTPSAAC